MDGATKGTNTPHVLRDQGTKERTIMVKPNIDGVLIAHVDRDFAHVKGNRRSTTGYLVYLFVVRSDPE
jgi:hypothetical protein